MRINEIETWMGNYVINVHEKPWIWTKEAKISTKEIKIKKLKHKNLHDKTKNS